MLIELQDVCYTYGAGTVYEVMALDHINLKISEGEFIGIIGHTGSGKSTLIQHFNGLIRPTSGSVMFEGKSPVLYNLSVGGAGAPSDSGTV